MTQVGNAHVSGRFKRGHSWALRRGDFLVSRYAGPFLGAISVTRYRYSLSVTDPVGALAPFGAIAADGAEPVGALSSVAPFAPDRRNSLATVFLSIPNARAICCWLIPEAKRGVIPCALSIESLFGIGDSSKKVTKSPL